MTFLMGLSDKYDNGRRQILLTVSLSSTSTTHSLLLQDDMSRKIPKASSFQIEGTALMINTGEGRNFKYTGEGKYSGDTRFRKEKCGHCDGNHKMEK